MIPPQIQEPSMSLTAQQKQFLNSVYQAQLQAEAAAMTPANEQITQHQQSIHALQVQIQPHVDNVATIQAAMALLQGE
jgi:hypothetical protein